MISSNCTLYSPWCRLLDHRYWGGSCWRKHALETLILSRKTLSNCSSSQNVLSLPHLVESIRHIGRFDTSHWYRSKAFSPTEDRRLCPHHCAWWFCPPGLKRLVWRYHGFCSLDWCCLWTIWEFLLHFLKHLEMKAVVPLLLRKVLLLWLLQLQHLNWRL